MISKNIIHQLDVCSCLATYLLNTDYSKDKLDKCLGVILKLDFNQAKLFFRLIMQSNNECLKLALFDNKFVTKWIKKYENQLHLDIAQDKMENWEEE